MAEQTLNAFRPSVEAHGRFMQNGTRRNDLETIEAAVDRGADVAAIMHASLDSIIEDVLDGKASNNQQRVLYGIMGELDTLADYLADISASMHDMKTTEA